MTKAEIRRMKAMHDASGEAYKRARGKHRVEIVDRAIRAENQSARIIKKRVQRQNFSKLSSAEKRQHREAGQRQFASQQG